jgi:hypothetical protein
LVAARGDGDALPDEIIVIITVRRDSFTIDRFRQHSES